MEQKSINEVIGGGIVRCPPIPFHSKERYPVES
jgi:hypothetical protein